MVVSDELHKIVKMSMFIMASAITSVVPISFLQTAISLVKYCMTISSVDSRETVNIHRTWLRTSFVEVLSSRSLSAFHICTGSAISSMSGRSSSQHPRCISAIA